MPPTAPAPSPLLVQRVVEGLKPPVAVVTGGDLPSDTAPPYGAVVVVAPDLATLRADLTRLPDLGRCRMVAVVVADATGPLPLRTDPRWPALQDLDARTEDGAAVTVARFTSRLAVAEVLAGIAHPTGGPRDGGLVVANDYDPDDKVPPDVVTRDVPTPESPVLGRPPVVVTDVGPDPLDETLFNPAGFRRDWDRGVVDLDPEWWPSPALVERLRGAQGVRVPDGADERLVTALAMSAVPLVEPGEEARLDDPVAREEQAMARSRAATLAHGTTSWRQRLADRAGVRVAP